MRIYYSGDSIQVDGLPPFPPRSLQTHVVGNNIVIHTISAFLIADYPYTLYQTESGQHFADLNSAVTYLNDVFARSMVGGVTDAQIDGAVDHALSDIPDFTLIFDAAAN